MSDEPTLDMDEGERKQARALSLRGARPPVCVPGYEQEQFLGKGTFGEVWRAVDSNNGRQVAIKFYHRRGGLDWALLSREVEKLRHLFSDRHVVQLFAVGWEADPPYYVMEYMENGSLEDRLRQGPLPVEEALDVFREVAVGLLHAHGKGILHCDLKPANVLLDQDRRPRLADFGQARLINESSPALGTLFYMAPEQADLQAAPDVRWDVYALGALLYHMLTGGPPHRTESSSSALGSGSLEERLARYRTLLAGAPAPAAHRQVPGVDSHLAEVIDRCLAPAPEKRFPNVQAVLAALEHRRARLARRPLLVTGLIGPALVMLVLAGVALWGFSLSMRQAGREVTDQALESNRLAALSVSGRFAQEVDRRFDVLEREANNKQLRGWLDEPPDAKATDELHRWLEQRRDLWDAKLPEGARSALWFVDDREGRQRASAPRDDRFLNKPFGWRDYFHGQGRNLDRDGPVPPPIRRPHRSIVYRRRGDDRPWSVAFSVPVFALPPDERKGPGKGKKATGPVGVLGMTSDLGQVTRFQGTRGQFAALVDLRPDEHGQRGLLVAHPALEEARKQGSGPVVYSPEVVKLADGLWPHAGDIGRTAAPSNEGAPAVGVLGDYRDPAEPASSPRHWLATAAPVVLSRPDARQTGWAVVVQDDLENTQRPLRALRRKLIAGSAVALVLVLLIGAAVWAYVLMVLGEAPAPRLLSYLRRKLGLPSGALGSGTGSGSAAHSGPDVRGAPTIPWPGPKGETPSGRPPKEG